MSRLKTRPRVLALSLALATTWWGLIGCAAPDDADAGPSADAGQPVDSGPDTNPSDGAAPGCAAGSQVVTMQTRDGVTLEADEHVAGASGGPSAILLHMVPPSNDRTNYPQAFIDLLLERGISVLNVDRRGAGGSDGAPEEAYLGPNGKWDALAAYSHLAAHPCGFDMARLAIVGASNGTTTLLDFTVFAATDAEVAVPGALVLLTGGQYTEAQNLVSGNRVLLDALPLLFVYSTAEAAWSSQFATDAPAPWVFREYPEGDHGTRMFERRPESMTHVADFIRDRVF